MKIVVEFRVVVLALMIAGLAAFVYAGVRTSSPRLDTSQGVGSVWEGIDDLSSEILKHNHTGRDGSSQLQTPFILGTVVLQSQNGSCWSCGPDNSGTWSCTSTTCP